MRAFHRHRIVGWLTAGLLLCFAAACDSGSNGVAGPESPSNPPATGRATLAGQVTASQTAATRLSAAGRSLAAADDPFIGARTVSGATILVLDDAGNTLLSTDTGADGTFQGSIPAGAATLVVELDSGDRFELPFSVPDGAGLFVRAKVDQNPSGKLTVNAEIVRDDNGDGVADGTFEIRVFGRVAGRPASGRVEIDDPEDQGQPAQPSDLFVGQRVRVRGAWDGTVLAADRVSGDCGESDQANELVGEVTARDDASLTVLGRTIAVDGDTRFAGRAHSMDDVAVGDRVAVRVDDDGAGGLVAIRITENGRSDLGDALTGRIETTDQGGLALTVLGVDVTLDSSTQVTSGDGCAEEGGQEDNGNDGNENEDQGQSATFGDLADGMTAVVVQGAFDGTVLQADHVTASSSSSRASTQVFGALQAVDVAGGTVTVLGRTFTLASDASIVGRFGSLDLLQVGMRVKLELEAAGGGGFEVKRLNTVGGSGPDMIQGAVIGDLDTGARTFTAAGVAVHATDGAVISLES